jgi:hypothetical protein
MAQVVGGRGMGIYAMENIRIRSLPALHGLMQYTPLPVKQVWVLEQAIAAEYDMVQGPVLRNSGMTGNRRVLSLSGYIGYESDAQHCSDTTEILWLHSYLQWRLICRHCSRFSVPVGISDFRTDRPSRGGLSDSLRNVGTLRKKLKYHG